MRGLSQRARYFRVGSSKYSVSRLASSEGLSAAKRAIPTSGVTRLVSPYVRLLSSGSLERVFGGIWAERRGARHVASSGLAFRRHPLAAVREIDHQADRQPNEKPDPRFERQTQHQQEAAKDRQHRKKRNPRYAKDSLVIRLRAAQKDHAGGDHHKSEQRANVSEVGESADVPHTSGNR